MPRLKRVFSIEIETRERWGGTVKIIASLEDPPVPGSYGLHLPKGGLYFLIRTGQSDLFSLGVALHQLLTGTTPFAGNDEGEGRMLFMQEV